MDVVSSGAGMLAFIGVAFQSTKSIYNVISAIRNGTEETLQLASAVEDMERTLEQLARMPQLSAVDEQQDFTELERLVRKCSTDLSKVSDRLEKMHPDPGESAVGKAWYRIKVLLKKEDILQMQTIFHHHLTILGLQLAILQGELL